MRVCQALWIVTIWWLVVHAQSRSTLVTLCTVGLMCFCVATITLVVMLVFATHVFGRNKGILPLLQTKIGTSAIVVLLAWLRIFWSNLESAHSGSRQVICRFGMPS